MRVIFLDIDGVINSHDNIWARTALWKDLGVPSRDKYGQLFDERCVRLLEWIISKTGCKIVISSTWRKSGLLTMERMWKDRGLPGRLLESHYPTRQNTLLINTQMGTVIADMRYRIGLTEISRKGIV